MEAQIQAQLRQIPSVDAVLSQIQAHPAARRVGAAMRTQLVREVIETIRRQVRDGTFSADADMAGAVRDRIERRLEAVAGVFYRRVVNAAGIILHTGLGRAPLAGEVLEQISWQLGGYSLLQVDVEAGKRSSRDGRIEDLLKLLTGAEAATVVNNNAAATALVLNTIAAGKEVIVSRGQLVEIGGAFRLPDVMAFSGARLVEVGTTNKTHLRDYENAITENTAAILRVHPSNYKITGFTSEVPLEEMVKLAHANGLLLFDDVGAGSLIDFSRFGFEKEPTLMESVAAGADVITSSGDKLIGASQAGIVLGRAEIIQKVRKNQFARIVRVDKFTLAALEATLKLFLDEAAVLEKVPALRLMLRSAEEIQRQAERICERVQRACPDACVSLLPGQSQIGSGSLPGQNLPTTLVAIASPHQSAAALADTLRGAATPVFTRIGDDRVLIDPRTLLDGDEAILIETLVEILH